MTWLIKGLVVYPENMLENMEKVRGMFFSQAVLLALTDEGVVREDAYSWVQRCAMRVWDEGVSLRDSLGEDEEITSRLSSEVLDRCFNLEHQLRNVPVIFERTLELKNW